MLSKKNIFKGGSGFSDRGGSKFLRGGPHFGAQGGLTPLTPPPCSCMTTVLFWIG